MRRDVSLRLSDLPTLQDELQTEQMSRLPMPLQLSAPDETGYFPSSPETYTTPPLQRESGQTVLTGVSVTNHSFHSVESTHTGRIDCAARVQDEPGVTIDRWYEEVFSRLARFEEPLDYFPVPGQEYGMSTITTASLNTPNLEGFPPLTRQNHVVLPHSSVSPPPYVMESFTSTSRSTLRPSMTIRAASNSDSVRARMADCGEDVNPTRQGLELDQSTYERVASETVETSMAVSSGQEARTRYMVVPMSVRSDDSDSWSIWSQDRCGLKFSPINWRKLKYRVSRNSKKRLSKLFKLFSHKPSVDPKPLHEFTALNSSTTSQP